MGVIKSGIGLTQTIKNMTRLKEIVTVFARNGLDEFVVRSGLHRIIPNFILPRGKRGRAAEEYRDAPWSAVIGDRLRRSFEELGPSFIKIGQLLSTREDLFPSQFVDQMKCLKDCVTGVPMENVLRDLDLSLGRDHREIFQSIDQEPLGIASIGIVYRAQLKDGSNVVIKVRRPKIKKTIAVDMALLEFIVARLEEASGEIKSLGISRIISEFSDSLHNELDFRREALSCTRVKERLAILDSDRVFYIPKVYDELTREDVLVLEELIGIPISSSKKINQRLEEVQSKMVKGIPIFTKMMLSDGFFHADPHSGNLFLLNNGCIGIVDFGLMGNLSRKSRSVFIAILYYMATHNYEKLVLEFLDIANYEKVPDIDELVKDFQSSLSIFVGLSVQQVDASLLLKKVFKVLSSHKIFLPREWFIVFRALVTLDGLGRDIKLDIEIFSIIDKDLNDLAKSFFDKDILIEEGLFTVKDVFSLLQILPRNIRWFLRDLVKNNYALKVDHRGHEKAFHDLRGAIIFFSYSFIAGIFFISGTLLVESTSFGNWHLVSKVSWIFWALAIIVFIKGVKTINK